MNWSQEKDSD